MSSVVLVLTCDVAIRTCVCMQRASCQQQGARAWLRNALGDTGRFTVQSVVRWLSVMSPPACAVWVHLKAQREQMRLLLLVLRRVGKHEGRTQCCLVPFPPAAARQSCEGLMRRVVAWQRTTVCDVDIPFMCCYPASAASSSPAGPVIAVNADVCVPGNQQPPPLFAIPIHGGCTIRMLLHVCSTSSARAVSSTVRLHTACAVLGCTIRTDTSVRLAAHASTRMFSAVSCCMCCNGSRLAHWLCRQQAGTGCVLLMHHGI